MYEDYEIDYDVIRERRWSHPVLLELERITTGGVGGGGGENGWEAAGTVVVRTNSSGCPAAYSRPGERWASVPMAEEEILANRVDGAVWVVSHGGAFAEPLRAIVRDRDTRAPKDDNESTLDRILAHYPYPVRRQLHHHQQKQPKLCIYIYGSV